MPISSESIVGSLTASIDSAKPSEKPYKNWFLTNCLPAEAAATVIELPFEAPSLDGLSGKRELHNNTRKYFDAENMARFPVCKAFNDAFQDKRITGLIERHFGTNLAGSYLRVEFAQDIDGFWLEPHTDNRAKLYTMLIYLSDEPGSEAWGTDTLDGSDGFVASTPHVRNGGLIFIPGADTWHGFHRRPIAGVQRSLIVNYVRPEWPSRHELAFPEQPVLT